MRYIFVSSTFKDFHAERDVLRKNVMPAVNESAQEYGEYVYFSDLRWGIDTTEEEVLVQAATEKVLAGCLDEIDRSRPYMIVLLGDRYGFVPNEASTRHEADKRGLTLDDYEISATQLEIEYGALHAMQTANVFFYFREITDLDEAADRIFCSENDAYREKLCALKERILRDYPDRVRTYQISLKNYDLSAFAKAVTDDLRRELIENEWKKYAGCSVYEKDSILQTEWMRTKAENFKTGFETAEAILTQMQTNTRHIITGESGIGKSTLFSYLCMQLEERGFTVLPFFVKTTAVTSSEEEILHSLIWQLETLAGTEHADLQHTELSQKHARLNTLCLMLHDRKIVIAVDAVEFFSHVSDVSRLYFVPDVVSENLLILLTGQKKPTMPVFCCHELGQMNRQQIETVIESVLHSNGKSLSAQIISAIAEKKNAGNPMYLYLVITRLCLFRAEDYNKINAFGGQMQQINEYLLHIIAQMTDELAPLAQSILESAADMTAPRPLRRAVRYMTASRRGLRFRDLEMLLEHDGLHLPQLLFSQFIHLLPEFFILKENGCFDFFHQSMRAGTGPDAEIHGKLADYLLMLPQNDSLRRNELVYHLMQCGRYQELYRLEDEDCDEWHVMDEVYQQIIAGDRSFMQERIDAELNEYVSADFLKFLRAFVYNAALYLREYSETMDYLKHIGITCIQKCDSIYDALLPHQKEKSYVLFQIVLVTFRAFEMLTEIMQNHGNQKEIPYIREYFQHRIEIIRSLFEGSGSESPYFLHELILVLEKYGHHLHDIGEQTECTVIYRQAHDLMNNLTKMEEGTGQELANAEQTCEIAIRLYDLTKDEQYAQDVVKAAGYICKAAKSDPVSTDTQCVALRSLADLYFIYGYADQDSDPMLLYEKIVSLREQKFFRKRTDGAMEDLIEAYLLYGIALTHTHQRENLLKAMQYYDKSWQFLEQKVSAVPIPEVMHLLVRLVTYMTNTACIMAEKGPAEHAVQRCSSALQYSKQLMTRMPTESNILEHFLLLHSFGQLFGCTMTMSLIRQAEQELQEARTYFESNETIRNSDRIRKKYAEVCVSIGECYKVFASQDSFEKALLYFSEAIGILQSMPDSDPMNLNQCENSMSFCLQQLGRNDEALQHAEAGCTIAEDLLAVGHCSADVREGLGFSLISRADACMELGRIQDAVSDYRRAEQIRTELNEEFQTVSSMRSLAIITSRLAGIYQQMSAAEKSMPYLRQSAALFCQTADSSRTSRHLTEAAENLFMLAAMEQKAGAPEAEYRSILEQAEQYYAETNPAEMTYRNYMTFLQFTMQRAKLAAHAGNNEETETILKELMERAEIFCMKYDSDYYASLMTDVRMGIIELYQNYKQDGWDERCLRLYAESVEQLEELWGRTHDNRLAENLISVCYEAGILTEQTGKHDAGMPLFRKAAKYGDILDRKHTELSLENLMIYYEVQSILGDYNQRQGKAHYAAAEMYFTRAIELEQLAIIKCDQVFRPESSYTIHRDLLRDHHNLTDICEKRGRILHAIRTGEDLFVMLLHLAEDHPDHTGNALAGHTVQMQKLYRKAGKAVDRDELYEISKHLQKLTKKYPKCTAIARAATCYRQIYQKLQTYDNPYIKAQRMLDRQAIELYTKCQTEIVRKRFRAAEETLQEFINTVSRINETEMSRFLLIARYNVYGLFSRYRYEQCNDPDDPDVTDYLRQSIFYGESALKFLKEDDAEVLTDLCDDYAALYNFRLKTGEPPEESDYLRLMQLLIRLMSLKKNQAMIRLKTCVMAWIGNIEHSPEEAADILKDMFIQEQIEPDIFLEFLEYESEPEESES